MSLVPVAIFLEGLKFSPLYLQSAVSNRFESLEITLT